MKKLLILLALISSAPAFAQGNAMRGPDVSHSLSGDTSSYHLIELGSGALGVLTFPEQVTNITTTREGIVESSIDNNHVVLAGLSNFGETPMLITTESGETYAWRVVLGSPLCLDKSK